MTRFGQALGCSALDYIRTATLTRRAHDGLAPDAQVSDQAVSPIRRRGVGGVYLHIYGGGLRSSDFPPLEYTLLTQLSRS